mmetsp:Transcript_37956/g.61488  ORF Transcript_37956/g.61488 Transcript_37956/m.61488 type:complete len:111 (-) Transcript_37956:233-565(-)
MISVFEISLSDTIQFQWTDDLLHSYSQCDLEYGNGRQIWFDFAKIEIELAHCLLVGKKVLRFEPQPFPYKAEAFLRSATILDDVRLKVRQTPLSSDGISAIQKSAPRKTL